MCRSAALLQCPVSCLSLLTCHLLPADLAELFAANDRLDGSADAVLVRLQLVAHLGNQRPVGEQHAAAQRIAEQLSTELFQKRIAPFREQVFAQALQAVELRA